VALERPVERGLGLVAYILGYSRQRHVAIAQLVGGELYAPARQVMHRRLANEPREPFRERRTRQAHFTPKIVDGPLLGDAAVKETERPRHEAVF
jgi:hypothetical protein